MATHFIMNSYHYINHSNTDYPEVIHTETEENGGGGGG
jgi:hypothetical protein